MCVGCWNEAGAPRIDNPKVREAIPLMRAIYDVHPAGGRLHLALDDHNLDDQSIAWLDNHLNEVKDDVTRERACLDVLKMMTAEERHSAVAAFWGFWKLPSP